MDKILVSPSSFGLIDREPLAILEEAGFEIVSNPFGRKLTEEEVVALGSDCIGIVAGVEPITRDVLVQCTKLKSISRVGVGMDSIDMDAANDFKIILTNTPDGPTQAVAELTLGLTFSLLRGIASAHNNMLNGKWLKETGFLLKDKVVGVIGLGRIGRRVSESFISLGNNVIGYDLSHDQNWCTHWGVKFESLEQLLSKADIITIHVPYDKKAGPLLSYEQFNLVKSGAFLVNVSRGSVVDENALKSALDSGKLAGAAIDVFENEPYEGELIDCKNVVLTPHIGSYAREGKLKMEIDAVNNLIACLKEQGL